MIERKLFVLVVLATMVIVTAAGIAAADTAKINVNTASAEELEQLKGVGPVYADRIVAYREQNGPFKTLQDLLKVKGIGPKTVAANQERIVFQDPQ